MARIARVVVAGYPHHVPSSRLRKPSVTQRGNRGQATFFGDDDYRSYLELMAERCTRCGVAVWAYCLMSNHAHLVAVPSTSGALASATRRRRARGVCGHAATP